MALTINKHRNDTVPGTVVVHSITIPQINNAADFAIINNDGKTATEVSLQSPLGYAEHFRFASSTVADVYANTSVDRALQAPSKKGTKILVAHDEVWSVEDSVDLTYTLDLPMSSTFTVTIPNNENVTEADVVDFIGRTLAGLFETISATPNTRVKSLLRRRLAPADL